MAQLLSTWAGMAQLITNTRKVTCPPRILPGRVIISLELIRNGPRDTTPTPAQTFIDLLHGPHTAVFIRLLKCYRCVSIPQGAE